MEVKSVGTFPVILLKLVTPPLPPQTKLNLEQNGQKWVLFMATTLLGEVEGRRDEPKAKQKIVLRSRVVHNNCLEGLFTQSQLLLSSIVENVTFHIGFPVVQTDRCMDRRTVIWQPKFLRCIDNQFFLPMVLSCMLHAHDCSPKIVLS